MRRVIEIPPTIIPSRSSAERRELRPRRILNGRSNERNRRTTQFVGAALALSAGGSLLNVSRVMRHSPFGWR
jgi:hypothetical protein